MEISKTAASSDDPTKKDAGLAEKASAKLTDVVSQVGNAKDVLEGNVRGKATAASHGLQETAQKAGHVVKELTTKAIHGAQERAQKVAHRAQEVAVAVQHQLDEIAGKSGTGRKDQ